ncbi:MAG: acyl carrier protein [Rhodobiaceae bacterium]|nr:acyl carrier protein [Rhodobiaceae bacterium]MCC0018652.1 acyl carrier protein [Rhodobiaceae bacterium]MCC0051000.1 acyl carrier protein [Rhodobiaceae bacterium]MCC0060359.1 acyl carrier protein [Rhodobiaceae bacterium]
MNTGKESTIKWPDLGDPERLEQIIDIIEKEGKIDRDLIRPDATLETLGFESIDVVLILMGIEDKFDVYLPMDDDLAAATNLAEFVAAVGEAAKAESLDAQVAGK